MGGSSLERLILRMIPKFIRELKSIINRLALYIPLDGIQLNPF